MKRENTKKDRYGVPDKDNPEWTSERIRSAVPFSGLPADLQRVLRGIQAKRGLQKAPRKVPISIRLSPDVAEGLRATGEGWQRRADEALRAWLADSKKRRAS